MVGADKAPGIAVVGAAYRQAAMGTAVDAGVQAHVPAAGENNRGFAHIGLDEITGVPQLGLVPQEQPGAAENAPLLQGIDLGVRPAAAADQGGVAVDQVGGPPRPCRTRQHPRLRAATLYAASAVAVVGRPDS